jgi:uncharacterized protein involved in type VI secretion and phage assembly
VLEFEGEPSFLERYSVTSFEATQTLGRSGVLTLNLHPLRARSELEFETHCNLQETLGEQITCSIDDWRFVGTIEGVETNTQLNVYKLTVCDALSKLGQEFVSQVFADQTVEDIVSALMPSGQNHECLGDCGSVQVRFAIQFQESKLRFLKRLLNNVGGQIWCAGDTVYVGTAATSESYTLRLGRDIRDYTIVTRLGPESVSVEDVPYASSNSVEQSSVDLPSRQYGAVQDGAIQRRTDHQTESTLHVTHEDSSYENTSQMARHFLRSQAAGRFTLTGAVRAPVTLGAALSIENYDREAGEVRNTEETVITRINVVGERASGIQNWMIRAENPESLLSNGEQFLDRTITSTAIVSDVDDPLETNRLRVYFPWDPNQCSSPWLRVSTPSWGDQHGHYLPPELGDTVLVAWGQCDMDPVVLGSVAAGAEFDLRDETFALKTVDGQSITIGEDNIKLQNEARGGSTVIEMLSDQVIIKTGNGQTVTIGSDSVVLDNGSGCTAELGSSGITISGTQIEISNSAGASITLNGPTVSINNGALEVT